MSADYGRGDLMLIAAVRYCLGRQSYIVGDCADWIVTNWATWPDSAKEIIRRDIDEAFERDLSARVNGWGRTLGMDMDRAEWERVRALWSKTDA